MLMESQLKETILQTMVESRQHSGKNMQGGISIVQKCLKAGLPGQACVGLVPNTNLSQEHFFFVICSIFHDS